MTSWAFGAERSTTRRPTGTIIAPPMHPFLWGTPDEARPLGDGSRGLLPFAYIGANAPEPFKREWSGGEGNMVHHKFVVTDFNGVSVVVDRMSVPYLNGAEIDFVDTIEKQGFTIDNPNATSTCACGDSFH